MRACLPANHVERLRCDIYAVAAALCPISYRLSLPVHLFGESQPSERTVERSIIPLHPDDPIECHHGLHRAGHRISPPETPIRLFWFPSSLFPPRTDP